MILYNVCQVYNFYSYQNLSFNMLKINFINKYKEYMNDIESIYDNESKSLIYIFDICVFFFNRVRRSGQV